MPPDHRPSPSTGPAAVPGGEPSLRQFIFKVHSRCDLACRYCYVYTMSDQGWRDQPGVMSRDTIDRAADRIAEYAHRHGMAAVELVLHGGEPLLAGPDTLAYCVRRVRAALGPAVLVRATVQTNAMRLTRAFLELFQELDVRVGVSVDGARAAHDRHRRDRRGRGSYTRVAQALRDLQSPRFRDRYAGLLCTVDLRNDPLDVYHGLLAFRPPMIDLLLPHGSWSAPPPGRDPGSTASPYGQWLGAVFDRWYDAPQRETRVRVFEEVIHLLLGGHSRYEGIGLGTPTAVVVRTDGGLQESDHLAATSGLPASGLNVVDHPIEEILRTPTARARNTGIGGLSATCRSCRLVPVCGGGLYSHRYRRPAEAGAPIAADGLAGSGAPVGFDNPSVYCADLTYLIRHVRERLVRDVSALAVRSD